jgi:uroporphyrinogen-III synthase
MSYCLITRAQPGALASATAVSELGYVPIVVPAAVISPTHVAISTGGVQALLMTSAAAARNTKTDAFVRALPVYAVGDATAESAIQAGFENVISAGGDGAALAVLAADRMKPSDGALLHVRGQEVAGDVAGMLSACGFETRFVEVYQTHDHPDFRADICSQLREKSGIILLHSPAGARRLNAAIANQAIGLAGWTAFGLSLACVMPIENSGFKALFSADRPDEEGLMEAISYYHPHSRS